MTSIRRWTAALVALGIASGLGAVELDGTTSGSVGLSPAPPVFAGAGSLTLTRRFGQDAKLALSGSLSYSSGDELSYSLDRAEYTQTAPMGDRTIVSFALGRGRVRDTTGLLSPLTADGLALSYRVPGFGIDAGLRTFALVAPEQSLVLTTTDVLESTNEQTRFGPARVLGSFALVFPERLGRTNLSFEYLTQMDGRAYANPAPGDDTLRADYLSGVVSFPFSRDLFATASVSGSRAVYEVVGTGVRETFGVLARAELRGYIRGALAPTGTVRAIHASGRDQPGRLPDPASSEGLGFVPGPFAVPWTIAPVPLQNVIAAQLEASVLPFGASGPWWLEDSLVRAHAIALAKPSSGAFGVAGVANPDAPGVYGYELEITAIVEPFSDLDFRFSGAIFLPDRSAIRVFEIQTEGSWTIDVAASLAW